MVSAFLSTMKIICCIASTRGTWEEASLTTSLHVRQLQLLLFTQQLTEILFINENLGTTIAQTNAEEPGVEGE